MKRRLSLGTWTMPLLLVVISLSCYLITELGNAGTLHNPFLCRILLPQLQQISSFYTDLKFKLRGPRNDKSDIIIVEVDSASIDALGRWPWKRDLIAWLIERTYELGAKVVGADIIFSEPEEPASDALREALKKEGLDSLLRKYATDPKLAAVIQKHKDQLVLAWGSDAPCQPLYSTSTECPVSEPKAIEGLPQNFTKYSIPTDTALPFIAGNTPIVSAATFTSNLALFNKVSEHQGFANAPRDSDGIIRRAPLVIMANGKPYPSIALEMASVVKNSGLKISFDSRERVKSLRFDNGYKIPVNPTGIMDINFVGPENSFTYISARDVLREEDSLRDEVNRKLSGISKTTLFKDAVVLIGVTALGAHDMTATPFAGNMPGVEIQATVLDNLISETPFHGHQSETFGSRFCFLALCLLMTAGPLVFFFIAKRAGALAILATFIGTMGLVFLIDSKILFNAGYNLNTGFFYLEMTVIMGFTFITKYIAEENSKKFLRAAFSKYVSPDLVDIIVKDRTDVHLGGEKKELSVLFSDIRGFTSFSEMLDVKQLTELLNEYFDLMTNVIFENGGTLDKYIGDAVMAFFGAPLEHEYHAQHACKAAHAMQRVLAEHRPRFKSKYGVDVYSGIGINSGIVNVGNMGSEAKFSYTVLGDNVNLAARLEGLTKKYGVEILTTHLTLDYLHSQTLELPEFRIVDVVKVKGKSEAVQLLEILTKQISHEGLGLFEEARELYRNQKWEKAIIKFQDAQTRLGDEDGPSLVYIDRCKYLQSSPPPKDWDGAWALDEK